MQHNVFMVNGTVTLPPPFPSLHNGENDNWTTQCTETQI
jgi:hypothetical protein